MFPLRVVPLFETLDDLNAAGAALRRLIQLPWYRKQLRCGLSLYYTSLSRTHKTQVRWH